jgi:hypothetical protein
VLRARPASARVGTAVPRSRLESTGARPHRPHPRSHGQR